MKNNIRWKLLPFVILVVAGISLFVFLHYKGFRIAYAPDLENSWDAISAFAAWFGAFASLGAIIVAIRIPEKIADRQDKIALFEMRMECYSTLQNIFAFAGQISEVNSKKGIQAAFKLYFGEADRFSETQNYTWYTITLKRQEPIIVKGMFLFPEYKEEPLQDLLIDIITLSGLGLV